ncbi:hypothetical protein D3C81_2050300 [compost metagenome]
MLYHAVASAFGRAAVQIQHRFLQLLGQDGLQHLAHADILGEDQAALILLAQLPYHGEQPLQLRRPLNQGSGIDPAFRFCLGQRILA